MPLIEQPAPGYRASWRRYRRWHLASLGLFILFLPVFAIAAHQFPSLTHGDSVIIPAFFAYVVLWMAVSGVARRWFGHEATVRPSLGIYNDESDIALLVRALRELGAGRSGRRDAGA